MVISIRENHEKYFEFENFKFEKVHRFKNLGVSINRKNNNMMKLK